MQNFHALMAHLIANGQFKPNRTGTGTYADVGHMLKFDLTESFPAITTKKLAFKTMTAELLGFFRGCDNAAQFRALGCGIWDQNANETPAWLANPNRKGEDDLGRIYSAQWTKWRDTRVHRSEAQALAAVRDGGYELVAADPARNAWVVERTINQLEEALRTLITDPYNRRIIINGWRPDEADLQCLPVCHVLYSLTVLPDGTLHSTLFQRSFDVFLAFNISTLALITEIFARLAGLKASTATMFIGDAHIYENHVEQVKLQLSREHFEQPKLVLSDNIKPIVDLADIKGAFERIQPEDIWLEGYQSHAAIKAPMAA
jgi:thymidylate synthase